MINLTTLCRGYIGEILCNLLCIDVTLEELDIATANASSSKELWDFLNKTEPYRTIIKRKAFLSLDEVYYRKGV